MTLPEHLTVAVHATTRRVCAAYPDASVDFRGVSMQTGERPHVVARYLVTLASGAVLIVRLEDAVWVVTDEDGNVAMDADLFALAAPLVGA